VRSAYLCYLTIRDPARLPGVRMADEDLAISFGSFSTDDTKKAISSDYHVRLPGAVDVMFCRSSNLPHSTSTLPPSQPFDFVCLPVSRTHTLRASTSRER